MPIKRIYFRKESKEWGHTTRSGTGVESETEDGSMTSC